MTQHIFKFDFKINIELQIFTFVYLEPFPIQHDYPNQHS